MKRWSTAIVALFLISQGMSASDDLAPDVLERIHSAYVFVDGGSGVIIDAKRGLVLTNHHVIDGEEARIKAGKLLVRLADGRSFAVELLGIDPFGDLALLRILKPEQLRDVALASGSDLRPGIDVWALGNPFGLGDSDHHPTLTRGVLSTARISRGNYTDAVQTDAPVNPGNSGGPLHDAAGRLLGINGQIRTVTGMRVNSGIGLAIAATQIAEFLPRLLCAHGGIVRHTAPPKGLEFTDAQDGPVVKSATAGLLIGDRIMRINGRLVASAENVEGVFRAYAWTPGVTALVAIERAGNSYEIAVPLQRVPLPGRPYLGWRYDEREVGEHTVVRITNVDDGSPLWNAGVRSGCILRTVNGKPIQSRADALLSLAEIEPGDEVRISVEVDGKIKDLSVTVDNR